MTFKRQTARLRLAPGLLGSAAAAALLLAVPGPAAAQWWDQDQSFHERAPGTDRYYDEESDFSGREDYSGSDYYERGRRAEMDGMNRDRMNREQMNRGNMGNDSRMMNRDQDRQAGMQQQQRRLSGTVQDVREVNLRNRDDQATLVLLRMQNGQTATVDLGTDVAVDLREGSSLTVTGRVVNMGQERYVLRADVYEYEGERVRSNQPDMAGRSGSAQGSMQGQYGDRGTSGGDYSNRSGSGNVYAYGRTDNQGQNQDREQWNRDQRSGQSSNRPDQQNRSDRQSQAQGSSGQGAGQARPSAPYSEQDLATLMFDRFDQNDDGVLTLAEWDDGFDQNWGEQAVDLDPSEWDRNGNNTISRNEFTQALQSSGVFEAMDANGNGEVSTAELQRFDGMQTQSGQQQSQRRQGNRSDG